MIWAARMHMALYIEVIKFAAPTACQIPCLVIKLAIITFH